MRLYAACCENIMAEHDALLAAFRDCDEERAGFRHTPSSGRISHPDDAADDESPWCDQISGGTPKGPD